MPSRLSWRYGWVVFGSVVVGLGAVAIGLACRAIGLGAKALSVMSWSCCRWTWRDPVASNQRPAVVD